MATRYLIPPCKRNLPKPRKKPDLISPLAIQLILLDRKVLKPPNIQICGHSFP